jgi:uncharacterized membrane protein HdeD (DUF308 family)
MVTLTAPTFVISGILAIIIGIVVLIFPKSLNYAVALYLIIAGILQIIAGY